MESAVRWLVWWLFMSMSEVAAVGLGFVCGGTSGALFLGAIWFWIFVNVSYFIVRE